MVAFLWVLGIKLSTNADSTGIFYTPIFSPEDYSGLSCISKCVIAVFVVFGGVAV